MDETFAVVEATHDRTKREWRSKEKEEGKTRSHRELLESPDKFVFVVLLLLLLLGSYTLLMLVGWCFPPTPPPAGASPTERRILIFMAYNGGNDYYSQSFPSLPTILA